MNQVRGRRVKGRGLTPFMLHNFDKHVGGNNYCESTITKLLPAIL